MSSLSSAYKTIYGSSSSNGHSSDSVGQDQGQMLCSELGLMEMTDVECSHLQHLIQAHMEVQSGPPDGPDARPHPPAVTVKDITGLTSTQAIDLSTSGDDYCLVVSGEKTPVAYGDVPGFVLARIRDEESSTEPAAKIRTSSQKQSRSAARVCLEKRFDSLCADTTRPQDIHSAVLSNLLTVLQQSAEAQDAVIPPQMQKWMKADRANPFEVPGSYRGGAFDPVTNLCGQVIAHMVEPNKPPSLIIPKSFAFNFHPESLLAQTIYTNSSNSREEQQLVKFEKDAATPAVYRNHHGSLYPQPRKAAEAAPDSAGESQSGGWKKARSCLSLSQRRERHNTKERERRKRIRLCCDELNTMVPFCDSDTDKVTTLQWTTAYLRYINKMYGDAFKEEFQKVFTHERGVFLKCSPSSGQHPIHQDTDTAMSIPLAAEQ
ncbi:uncharacterized protein [Leuresthes tenuis]|uniref:uncharacterized protein n=1 Tax=Leuresthes tenuis TaxID=355514 RepID=UPI003B50CC8E